MQIPVLNGIYTDGVADFRVSYPRNLVPVPIQHGISNGYLRPADGLIQFGTGPGVDRGGINWNGQCYRVMGTKLVRIDSAGTATVLGDVGGSGQVTFDYSFDKLAIASSGQLFYWNNASLSKVTDADLGTVLDVLWVDGYFMTTDGTSLVVTELTDPTQVNPLKYGSSEIDPDPIKGILKLRNEVYALNRHTIEVFDNIGGDFFPFQRIDGAQIQKGTIGTHAACTFMDVIAFVGSGRNEAPAVYLGANSQTTKVSTREIDQILAEYTETELSQVVLESRVDKGHQHLWIRLPDRTLVYDGAATAMLEEPVWFTLSSSIVGNSQYRAQNLVWCYNKWLCGDPAESRHGYLTDTVSSHYGARVGWDFGTVIIYNESRGALFHELELVSLTGRNILGDTTIWTSYSTDGEVWSQERSASAGVQGNRNKRISWLQQGHMRSWRIQKFRGTSDAFMSVARLEATLEPLAV
jgi:hypothetical protein